MKKLITLGAIFALSVSTVVEAKKGGMRMSGKKSTPAVQTKPQTQQNDATFNNTPPMPNAGAQAAQSNRLGNFVTGAAAGYLLSEALSPNEAQAQQPATQAEPMAQLNQQVQTATPTIPSFKAVDPQNDPNLIEKTPGYLRYCLNGVQYLVSTANPQLAPTLMVDRQNAPAACVISQ